MSVRTMAYVWEHSVHSGTHLLMLLAIADFADDAGRAYPSVSTLAKKCRMKPRNANVILAALRASGELSVIAGQGPKGTNVYRVRLKPEGVQSLAGVQERAGVQSLAPTPAKDCSPPCKGLPDTPAKACRQTISEPSLNHQEPSERVQRRKRATAKHPLPDGFSVSSQVEAWAAKEGHSNLQRHLEVFKLKCRAGGLTSDDWEAKFQLAITENWAKVGAMDSEPQWRREQRERNEAFLGPAAAKRSKQRNFEDIDYSEGVSNDGTAA